MSKALTDACSRSGVCEQEPVLVSLPSGCRGVFRSFLFLLLSHQQRFDHSPAPAASTPHCQPFPSCWATLGRPSSTEAPSLEISRPHLGRSLSSGPRPGCWNQTPLPSSHICNPDLSQQRALTADYKQSVARLVHQTEGGQKGAPLETLAEIF